MHWKKLGQLYEPTGIHPKLATHASNPLAILLAGDVYRVFFNGRDNKNRSSIGAVDIDIVKRKVIQLHNEPFFTHGRPGSFYESGVSIGCTYAVDNIRYLLFMGWRSPRRKHWQGEIGRLVLTPELGLLQESERPFLSISDQDPISLSYPWIVQDRDLHYHMWYGSTIQWETENGEMLHIIKHAESKDGVNWDLSGGVIPYSLDKAQAFSRPTVVGDRKEGFHMWFSFRGNLTTNYRIGYACSSNGIDWKTRLANVGIDVSCKGWDSEMIEYPFVFRHREDLYMLYNGNRYGSTGFGLAVLEKN